MATTASKLGWVTLALASATATWDARGREIVDLDPGADRLQDWLDRIHPDDRGAVAAKVWEADANGDAFDVEYRVVDRRGSVRVIQGTGMFERTANPAQRRGSALMRDVTELRNWEASQHMLVGELNHRVKNMLAVVQSVARQTLRSDPDPATFAEAFEQRVQALARAHGMLTRRNWAGVSLRELAGETLGPLVDGSATQIRIEGPPINVSPSAAVSLVMALHELGTNATKHGALSTGAGSVALTWRTFPVDGGGDGRIALAWAESDGPKVTAPGRVGFGSTMLRKGLARELGGSVDIAYAEDGVICTMEFPLGEHLRQG